MLNKKNLTYNELYFNKDGRDGGCTNYRDGSIGIPPQRGIQTLYDLRKEAMDALQPDPTDEVPSNIRATIALNNWINRIIFSKQQTLTNQEARGGYRVWTVRISITLPTPEGSVKYFASAIDSSKKRATEEASQKLLDSVIIPHVQMDREPSKESVQGITEQASEQQANTIVTRDQGTTKSVTKEANDDSLLPMASSEKITEIDDLVGRWMPMTKVSVSTAQKMGDVLASYYLPQSILTDQVTCSPAIIPFETFIYGRYDMALKFIVNANAFHCGKVIVSVKFDSYQADDINNGYQAALSRKHVILDLNSNNEATLDIPFRYHRAFIRNQSHNTSSVGVRPGKYCTVQMMVLSPLRTGAEGSQSVDIRPMYIFRKAKFAGMSYRVPQIQGMETLIAKALPLPAIKELIIGMEKAVDQLGKSHNQDKPTDHKATVFIPRPRMHFPNGKGVSDASSLRMTPNALTSFDKVHAYKDEPKTTLDIAKIWGLRNTFEWSDAKTEGTILFNSIIDPTMRSYTETYDGQPTPLEYVASFYNFWSGPMEMRFDFVTSNMGHTGAVTISAEFNRDSGETDECQSHSCYVKTFHLGEQKSCSFVIPYIYDTVVRRSCGTPYQPLLNNEGSSDDIRASSISVRPESRMRVKVRVLNALRPVSTVSSVIEVLVYLRAGPKFHLHALKQSDFYITRDIVPMDSFPNDNYAPVKPRGSRPKREVPAVLTPDDISNGLGVAAKDRYLLNGGPWNEKPTVQMDNGEKENEDTTKNFNHGESANSFMSVDSQVGIKDILRRPVLMFNNVTIVPSTTGFFIPLMPPSRMMAHKANTTTQFSNMIGQTPQAMLMNLFRFWRGSMRYTIICHDANSAPLFVTHVPHSGSRLYANKSVGRLDEYLQVPIYGSGLSTDILIPSVNSTTVVEAPYDTENNWTLTFDEDAARNYAWRDKGDTCSGHIVISSERQRAVSIFWSAGDDFDIANFYGIPSTKSNNIQYSFSDKHARVQMDTEDEYYDAYARLEEHIVTPELPKSKSWKMSHFLPKNVSTVVDAFATAITPARMVTTAIMATPYIGSAYGSAVMLDTVKAVGDKTISGIEDAVNKMDILKERLESKMGQSIDVIMGAIETSVNTMLQGMTTTATIVSYCYDMILDIFIAWFDKSWTAIGVGIVRFLGKILGITSISSIIHYAEQIGAYVRDTLIERVPRVQMPPPRTATIIGILAGLVGTIFRVKIKSWRYENLLQGFYSEMTDSKGVSYLFTVLKFVESTFTAVKEMVMEALGYISPEAHALRLLSAQSPLVEAFVREAQLITSEANGVLIQDPRYRLRFWKTVMQAYQFQRLISSISSPNVAPHINRICQDVIKVGNEKFLDISASPVRYEPFVLTIQGKSGVGKSEIVSTIVTRLLEKINFSRPHSENIYYKMPAAKFWSGYRDQPVICYDDWLAISSSEAATLTLTELFNLKSTAIFIPEMAHLEEKKIRANPLIVIMLCNDAFPQNVINNLAHTPEAIYRRREVILRAERKPEYIGVDLREMDQDDQINFNHLEFSQFTDVADPKSESKKKVDYETMMTWLEAKFERYHKIETKKVQKRMQDINTVVTGQPITEMSIRDPFEIYYSVNNNLSEVDTSYGQNGYLPSEILAAEITRLVSDIANHNESQEAIQDNDPPRYDPIVSPWEEEQLPNLHRRIMNLREPRPLHQQTVDEHRSGEIRVQGPIDYVTNIYRMCVQHPGSFLFGVATTKAGVNVIATWTSEMCDKVIDSILNSGPNVAYPCSVCQEDGMRSIICEDSAHLEQPHYVCVRCHMDANNVHDYNLTTCPACRSENIIPIGEDASLAVINILARSTIKTAHNIRKISEFLLKNLGGTRETAMSILIRMINTCTFTTMTSPAQGAAYSYGFLVPSLSRTIQDIYQVGQLIMRTVITTQSDGFDLDEEPDVVIEVDNVFNPQIEAGVVEYLTNSTEHYDTAPCSHQGLLINPIASQYRQGKFYYIDNSHLQVSVSEYPCQVDCPLTRLDTYNRFLQRFIDIHTMELNSTIRSYYNLRNNVEYYRGRCPLALQPNWMRPNQYLDAELLNLSKPNWWDKLSEFYSNHKTLIITMGAVTVAITGLFSLKAFFRHTPEMRTAVQGGMESVSGDQHTRFVKSMKKDMSRGARRIHFQGADITPSIDAVVRQQIAGNYVSILIETEKGERLLNACGFANRTALLPRHYVEAMEKANRIHIFRSGVPHTTTEYVFNHVDFVLSPISDLASWSLPASFGFFKDIRKFLATDADLDEYLPVSGSILLAPNRKNLILKDQPIEFLGIQNSQIVQNDDGSRFEVHDVLTYNYSQPGACGSIVLFERSQRPIVGMHFAGIGTLTTGEGFSVILTKESLGDFGKAPSLQMEEVDILPMAEAHIIMSENSNVDYIGSLPKEKTPHSPQSSKIRPSLIQGVNGFETFTEPCVLHKSDPRYLWDITPLRAGIEKHGKLTSDFLTQELDEVEAALWDGWICKLKPSVVDPQRLSESEAICGFDTEYYDKMILSKSAGFPWICTDKKSKCDYITVETDANEKPIKATVSKEVQEVLDEKRRLRRNGIIPFTPFVDSLKDERKVKDKVLKLGGTRVFCNPPMDYVISMRQDFMHFTASYMKDRFNQQHGVGINPLGTEWTQLASKLISKSVHNVCTLDYSNFGPGFNCGVAERCMNLMVRWTLQHVGGVNENELRCHLYECLYSTHISNNTVYRQKAGSPSGAPITVIINTMVNQFLILLSWAHITKRLYKEKLITKDEWANRWDEYKENVALFTYGDDLIMSVTDKYIQHFNSKTISGWFSTKGIVATDATKQKEVVPYTSLYNATFLKRGFLHHPNRKSMWLSPIDPITINECVQWIWECKNYKVATHENAKAGVMMAHGYGIKYYNEFKTKVNQALVLKNVEPVKLSWDDIDSLYFEED